MLRLHVNEVDVEPVDLGDELRKAVQLRLGLTPIVLGRPIARELLRRRELNALRRIGHRFALGPFGRLDAPPQVAELRIRSFEAERMNVSSLTARHLCAFSHHVGHRCNPPGKTEETELAPSNGCRCRGDKAAAIEVARF